MTLTEKVSKNYSKVKLGKASVKVPKLKVRKISRKKRNKDDDIPIASIINILIKTAVDKAKREKKGINLFEEGKSYILLGDKKDLKFNGGYGSIFKGYSKSLSNSYVDYEKLFNYLGKFRSQSAYENIGENIEAMNKSAESSSFTLIDNETMEKGANYVRYFNSKIPIDKSSLVPIAGMNSTEWEQFKLWMRLDTAIYLLKISTS